MNDIVLRQITMYECSVIIEKVETICFFYISKHSMERSNLERLKPLMKKSFVIAHTHTIMTLETYMNPYANLSLCKKNSSMLGSTH